MGFCEIKTTDNEDEALERLDLMGGQSGLAPDVTFVDIKMLVWISKCW
jgi:hypothetical protein